MTPRIAFEQGARLTEKFPTIAMVQQAAVQVLFFKKGLGLTVGYLIAIAAIIVLLVMMATGGDLQILESAFSGDDSNGTVPVPDGFGLMFFIAFIGMVLGYAWIFNMWIRFGAFGASGAFFHPVGAGLKAAGVTALKLFFIGILLIIVGSVAVLILAAIGIIDLNAAQQAVQPTLTSALTLNLVTLAVISGVYSMFSSNLTYTALGSDSEEVGPPHLLEFAVVLFILDALLVIPLVVLQIYAPVWTTTTYQLIGGIWITAAIPLAHGVRYDWQRQQFAGETAAEQFDMSVDEPDDGDVP